MSPFAAFAVYVQTSCLALGVSAPHVEATKLAWDISAEASTDGYGPVIYVDTWKLSRQDMERLAWHECVHLKLRHHERPLTRKQQHGDDFKALMDTFGAYQKKRKRER